MKLAIVKGSTSYTVDVFIEDTTKTDGGGLTGLVFNSAGLTAYYIRPRAAPVAITLATLAAITSAWSSGGFKEYDATNAPGWYRLDIPDAALASGVDHVGVHLKGAANMAHLPLEIQLTSADLNDAAALGLSRLDAAVSSRMATFTLPANFASLVVDANGRVDLSKWLGAAPAALSASGYVQALLLRWLTDNAAGTPNALISGRVDANAQVVGDKTGYTASTVSDKTGYALTAGEHTNIAADAQTGLTAQGYTSARAGFLDTLNGLVAAVWNALTSTFATAGSVGKRIADNLDAAVSSRLASGAVTVGTNNDKTGYSLTAGEHTLISGTDVPTALTAQGYTSGRAPKLDQLDAAVSSRQPSGNVTVGGYAAGQDPATLVLSSATIEGRRVDEALRVILDAASGCTDGAGTGTFHLKSKDGAKTRATVSTDPAGNRTLVVWGDLT